MPGVAAGVTTGRCLPGAFTIVLLYRLLDLFGCARHVAVLLCLLLVTDDVFCCWLCWFRSYTLLRRADVEAAQERFHAEANEAANAAHAAERPAGGVVDVPVFVSLAGIDG